MEFNYYFRIIWLSRSNDSIAVGFNVACQQLLELIYSLRTTQLLKYRWSLSAAR